MKQTLIFLAGMMLFANSCTSSQGKTSEDTVKSSTIVESNPVKTISLERNSFKQELISNGKLCALLKTEMPFVVSGKVKSLLVKNGNFVAKGDTIAILEDFDLNSHFEKSKQLMAKAKLEMENILIGQGYDAKDIANIPQKVLNIAKLKSGLNNAILDYQKAEHDLKATRLVTPFSGVVANLSKKLHQQVESGKVFCTLIDSKNFEVEFTVLESEIYLLSVGQQVSVQAFALEEGIYKGKVTQINPMVDENGLVTVKALIQNKDGKLLEGLNVKVIAERTLHHQLIIPKSALLLRQNKQVVFTYRNGKALWNYVKTGLENSEFYTIVEGLNEGDEVIVEGSLNLAHESEVEVIN
jgi:RND family efflux transporter MFP subunit